MSDLYPEIEPYLVHNLAVGDGHTLYVEECGNPAGIPALFLHGGPGAGCERYHRRFFDPRKYRIILVDQRGSGRSTPHASLQMNNTQALVGDIETIRESLGVERWLLFGGSWGSTLALAYAEAHPRAVSAMVLRGIFLCRPHEIEWFYQQGASRIFPDYWQDFVAPIDASRRHELLHAYYEVLTGDNELKRLSAARTWSVWEGRTATLLPDSTVVDHFGSTHVALSLARIECHYFVNDSFLDPNQLLRDAGKLAGIPGIIVHGRYDMICPLENAWQLHDAWPESQLQVIADAGHSASERSTQTALVEATDHFAEQLV